MPKPILVVKAPADSSMQDLTHIQDKLGRRIPDWHIIVCQNETAKVDFLALAVNSAQDVDIEELKKIVTDSIK